MLPLSPAQITRLYSDALAHQAAGRLEAAEQGYRTILAANPTLAEAHFQLGRIALTRKDAPAALASFTAAAAAKPGEPAIWQGLAEAAAQTGDRAQMRAVIDRAKAAKVPAQILIALQSRLTGSAPKAPPIGRAKPAEVQALIAAFRAGRMDDAERRATAILKAAPDAALAADVLGNARMALGKIEAAAQAFRQAVRAAPDWPEAQNNLGHVLFRLKQLDQAEEALRRAVALSPDFAMAHKNLGLVHLERGDTVQALAAFRRATQADPKLAEAQLLMGHLLYDARNYAAAETAYRAAMQAGDDRPDLKLRLGQVLLQLGREDEALTLFDRGLDQAPDMAPLHARRALLLQRTGDFDGAEAGFRRALALDPNDGETYRLLFTTKKARADDPLIAEMQARFEDPATPDATRMHLGFALSKVMEDTKAYDRVFHYLKPANDLMRKMHPYDIATRRAEVDGLKRSFAGFDPGQAPAPGSSNYAPIFVTGMPRSGTTLVEQIIASHSRVTGAGEIGHAAREAFKLIVDPATGSYRPWSDIAPDAIAALGHDYEAYMRARFPEAIQVTDKSIQTYAYLGLIRLTLPKARIIVVRRDPRDNLLSIYRNLFLDGTHLYAYSLRDLGLYYRMFEELIDFWRDKAPGFFHEVRYEDLIADPETQSRALIAACGLDWEDACLNFHENKRRVDTLSVYQVRQPIYSSSMKAWQRHAEDLGELFEALGQGAQDGA